MYEPEYINNELSCSPSRDSRDSGHFLYYIVQFLTFVAHIQTSQPEMGALNERLDPALLTGAPHAAETTSKLSFPKIVTSDRHEPSSTRLMPFSV
jgi:hypothetical protein